MNVTDIQHVLVLADDIDATRDFYRDVVGLQVGDRPALEFPGYWMYAGPSACIHIANRLAYLEHAANVGLEADGAGHRAGSIDHIAFAASDADELLARVDRSGAVAVLNQIPNGPRQVFIEDPNGVRVEINIG
jgi:catechol 2,3-dioxygenase-like lactoylglutathione lyase family enzyme